jgi:mannose-1-phosphate guanylyltransferase/phosphomannomutase
MSGVNVFAISGVTRPACALVADIMQSGLVMMLRINKQHLYVDIFEPELFMLSKNARHKIEARYFMQGEMLASAACGKETWIGAADSLYTNTVFQKINWSTIKASGVRVLVDGGRDSDAFAVRVMETCGIRVAHANGMDVETAMRTHGASFGVRFAKDGMVSALYLPSGRVMGQDEYKALSYYLVFSSLNKPVVNLPSGVSRSVVAAADVLNISYEFTSEEDAALDLSPDQRRVLYDGVFGICRVAEHMARSGVTADEVAAVIEQSHTRVKAISCDYDDIGRVIGGMYARGGAYANEGLRLDVQGGFGYICPHATRPTIIIRTEGDTEEFAEELCETYADMVRRIVRSKKDNQG